METSHENMQVVDEKCHCGITTGYYLLLGEKRSIFKMSFSALLLLKNKSHYLCSDF